MKLVLITVLFLSSKMVFAQEPTPTEPVPKPEIGTTVPPTEEQLNTVNPEEAKKPKAKAKAKKVETKKVEETVVEEKKEEPKTEVTETKKEEVKKEEKKSDDSEPHRFGFHADLNVPHILNYGLDYWHSSRWFSVALNGGGYSVDNLGKYSKDAEGMSFKISNQEAVARLHVFAGSFYVGVGAGKHTIEASKTQEFSITTPVAGSATIRVTDKITSNYLNPHIGWLWRASFGLTFGIDLGYMSQSSPSVDLKEEALTALPGGASFSDFQATAEYQAERRKIVDESEKVGKTSVPYLALFRLGWLF